jgi:coniferyl-aldehyde dehydrogenase
VSELQSTFTTLQQGFARQRAPSAAQRRAWLTTARALLLDHRERLCAAVDEDFGGRSPIETLGAEIMVSDGAIAYLLEHLEDFMAPERRSVGTLFAPAWAEVRHQPKGVVGVIGPWNYPVQLAFVPLVTALAAGNRVFLKPSELTPRTSALLTELLHGAFPEDLVRVVVGGAEVGQAFSALPFDHLFFTGSTAVGRHVMRAAAENLTPVTLELGGKSPAIVHRDASLGNAVERIAFAKCLNAGQTCIAVDYALVPRERVDAFVNAYREQVSAFFPSGLASNPDYTAIVNARHRERLEGLLADAEAKGATVVPLGPTEDALAASGKLPPTLVLDADPSMDILQEEIFGPVLPIVPYDTLDDAIAWVNDRPRPLALYYFDTDRGRADHVLAQTHAGGACINDTLLHIAQDDLPFGGIGASGLGAYHGREGFLTFSHAKAVFHQRRVRFTKLFNPPYGRTIRTILRAVLG